MNKNFLRQLQYVEFIKNQPPDIMEAAPEKKEEAKVEVVPGKIKDESLIRYNLTVFDLKKNFKYSSWKKEDWSE